MIELPTEELKELMTSKLKQCAHWKSSKDGSYQLALYSCGYYELEHEYNRRITNARK